MGYSVQIAPGASVSRDPPTLDSSTARLLFDIASAGHARGLELLTAASTIRIRVPAGGLPSAGPPVTVAAVRTNMAVVAASAAQSAFLILESLLQVIAAPEAAALSTALDASGNIDCITATVTAPGPVGFDQVLGGTQLGLRCLGPVLKGRATGMALTVLAAVTSFIATFSGALYLVDPAVPGLSISPRIRRPQSRIPDPRQNTRDQRAGMGTRRLPRLRLDQPHDIVALERTSLHAQHKLKSDTPNMVGCCKFGARYAALCL